MEHFHIAASILLLVISPLVADPQLSQSYGSPPSSVSFSNFNSGNSFNKNQDAAGFQGFRNSFSSSNNLGGNDPGASLGSNIPGPKVFRHISLFVAPYDSSEQQRVRTIKAPGQADTHYQIIFIKAPSRSSSQQTEIELPPQPEQKTLVYVLVKKPEEGTNNVKVLGPPPTKPSPPEVYFIKYKDGAAAATGAPNNGGGSFEIDGGALPVRSSPSLSSNYGVP